MNSAIHIILQPFSGIGKKFISSLLKQYISDRKEVRFILIDSMDNRAWDSYLNDVYLQPNIDFIITVSSVHFFTFKRYLSESSVLEFFNNSGRKLINHYIFTPGRNGELSNKILTFIDSETRQRVGANILWQNDNIGISLEEATEGNYLRLEQWPDFNNILNSISSIINLPKETYFFQKDLLAHVRSGENFNRAIHNSKNNIIFRQRLYQIQQRTFRMIKNANI